MYIKRVITGNFKVTELSLLLATLKLKTVVRQVEIPNIRQKPKLVVSKKIITELEFTPHNGEFINQITTDNKHHSIICGYRIDKDNFIAVQLGHQAANYNADLITPGVQQCAMFIVTASSVANLHEMSSMLYMGAFAKRLIEIEQSWDFSYSKEINVKLGV